MAESPTSSMSDLEDYGISELSLHPSPDPEHMSITAYPFHSFRTVTRKIMDGELPLRPTTNLNTNVKGKENVNPLSHLEEKCSWLTTGGQSTSHNDHLMILRLHEINPQKHELTVFRSHLKTIVADMHLQAFPENFLRVMIRTILHIPSCPTIKNNEIVARARVNRPPTDDGIYQMRVVRLTISLLRYVRRDISSQVTEEHGVQHSGPLLRGKELVNNLVALWLARRKADCKRKGTELTDVDLDLVYYLSRRGFIMEDGSVYREGQPEASEHSEQAEKAEKVEQAEAGEKEEKAENVSPAERKRSSSDLKSVR